jgi:ribose-phosphate pyrophosphokinase
MVIYGLKAQTKPSQNMKDSKVKEFRTSGNHTHLNYHHLIIISATSSPLLGGLEKDLLKLYEGDREMFSVMQPAKKNFSNGEFLAHVSGSVRDADVYILSQPRNDESLLYRDIFELLSLIRSCRTGYAHKVNVLVPCMPHARQDRSTRDREFASFRLVCDMLKKAGVDSVTTFELHNDATVGYMEYELSNQSTLAFLAKRISRDIIRQSDEVCHLIAPDIGSAKYLERMRSELSKPRYGEHSLNYSTIQKDRDPSTGKTRILGVSSPSDFSLAGSHCVMVDDMIDTGGTAAQAARYLCDRYGVSKVSLVATHGIFSVGCREKLLDGRFEQVCVTDSCPLPVHMHDFPGLQVWSLDGYLAGLVYNIHNGKSSTEIARRGGSEDAS